MGIERNRVLEKRVRGKSSSIPPGPVFYPTEEEFKDPLEFIYKIRPEAEPYGICKIVPPKNWKPPFALDLDSFTFPTKTQAIHQLQVRSAACDSKTFELEYERFLGRKKRKVVFEGKELDLCKFFNAVKRYGGYEKAMAGKKWGEVFRFLREKGKITECGKHVLSQLYREHLYEYENYSNGLNQEKRKPEIDISSVKRRKKNQEIEIKVEEQEFDQMCEQCRSGLHGEVMLLCDRCNKGWHIYCLSPPLKCIPPGNWYCLDCLNSEKDTFGFVPGKQFSLESFRRMADRAKKKWFGSESVSRTQIEKKFWEIVEGSVGAVEVMYGSDLDTSVHGSGFPRVKDQRPLSVGVEEWDKFCDSPWNLNNLPKLQGSMLQTVHHSIAGVMVPWLYIGMLFSSFCWHFEDHCFYSMNYHHWGEPKCWYSVPGNEAGAFEKVMKNSLPDLFDAQPDLLFQLVTMLNPSVLQENNVPVYSILQEPGNFVITFPRSYHGGFNLGLNCAEAVNFAPADWLPHGGFGAELYQLYRKPAVLSHDELLCVVAKSDLNSKISPYLIKELHRIYDKERTWRERLWSNGITKYALMSPRKQPKFVGVEEDPTCIICQQFLYLSAVACRCRPSAFVCLEHWEHLCECKANEHCLLYRHTLAELDDLTLSTEKHLPDEPANGNSPRHLLCSSELGALSKKVRGVIVTFGQLAEEWLMRSCKILQVPYSSDVYSSTLKEAEQFLWAGSEMELVRTMVTTLIEAQKWAELVRDCVSKVEMWSCHVSGDREKVRMEHVDHLLSFDPVPCNEPGYTKLKVYAQEARMLIQEINSALSTCSKASITDWEVLHAKARDTAIFVEEAKKLSNMLSFGKAWIDSTRKCISAKSPASVEVDVLYKLKSAISQLQVQLPEVEMLLDLIRQVESCQSRCNEILIGSMSSKKLEMLLQEFNEFTVKIPELQLLRQYQSDAVSWVSRFNKIVKNVHSREDQENVVDELTCIKKDGALLKIQVDELPNVEVELKKACCRVNAKRALQCKMSLDVIQEVVTEATLLRIEKENLFADLSGVLAVAMCWEERAMSILACEAEMSEFEDVTRTSENIFVILPSLDDIKEAQSVARSWLNKAKPFLASDSSAAHALNCLLTVAALKELVSESTLLKVFMEERVMLHDVLKSCIEWECDASSLLHGAEGLFDTADIGNGSSNGLISKIECQVAKMEAVTKSGLSLLFDFAVIPMLKDACSTLQWCCKAISFCAVSPELEEVEMLLEVGRHLPATYASCPLSRLLINGVNWLKTALEIPMPYKFKRFKLKEAVDVLRQSKTINVSFPVMVDRLVSAIKKHNLWSEQVRQFFRLNSRDRSWSLLLHLKELGSTDAFDCSELNMLLTEHRKIEQWKCRCLDIVGASVGKLSSLPNALLEIKNSLDRSLNVYDKSLDRRIRSLYSCCSSDIKDQDSMTCSMCNDCYHLRCIIPTLGNDTRIYLCPGCQLMESGKVFRNGSGPLKNGGKPPELNNLIELVAVAKDLCVRIEERSLLHQIVEKAVACKSRLKEIVDFALAYCDEDISIVTRSLSIASKALIEAGVFDHHSNSTFEIALARNSWRVRICKLLEGPQRTGIQQIQRHLKEGLTLSIPPEDHFWQKLTDVKQISMQWADRAKKVSMDSGELELNKVFELIMEGESLCIHFEKELKLLRDRSMLYCICRKPYDQRAMIACDECDEWYHFDCINLSSAPKIYICPACKLHTRQNSPSAPSTDLERATVNCEEPQTPSPRGSELKRKSEKPKSCTKRKIVESRASSGNGIGCLFWKNQKPFRRIARKRVELDTLSPFFVVQR